ncbi:MAG: zinc-ribbon domain-containing protein [Candidatus Tectomicrobia bacterium]|uniref:Zinc-ribbon domain-containing protein n=1 Tax=Tectimicrobiota bacterium TaxID=2528274 RepID=A0A932CLM2_UNCTE|nr:zinc-ribbon domain-containing protein [Candidatus Tectomicrobia bacterium]
MQCPRCHHENSETARFCTECGIKLVQVCPGVHPQEGPGDADPVVAPPGRLRDGAGADEDPVPGLL